MKNSERFRDRNKGKIIIIITNESVDTNVK